VGGNSAYCVKASTFGAVTYVHSALGALSDWVLALVPVFLVSNLQMNVRTKISVSIVLGLGGIAAIAVLVRIPYVRILVNSTDFLYDCTNVVIWTSIEPGLGLTAASLATLRPLLKAFLSRTRLYGATGAPNNQHTYGKSTLHSRSKFSMSVTRKGYVKSTSNGAEDLELGDRDRDFEMFGNTKTTGTVVTVINSPGFPLREEDQSPPPVPPKEFGLPDGKDGKKRASTASQGKLQRKRSGSRKRSESQTRLRKFAEQWGHARGVSSGDETGEEGLEPIRVQKTVEISRESEILL